MTIYYYPQSFIDAINNASLTSNTISESTSNIAEMIADLDTNPISSIRLKFESFVPQVGSPNNINVSSSYALDSSQSYIERSNGTKHYLTRSDVNVGVPYLLQDGRLVVNANMNTYFDTANADYSVELYLRSYVGLNDNSNNDKMTVGFSYDGWNHYFYIDVPLELIDGSYRFALQTTLPPPPPPPPTNNLVSANDKVIGTVISNPTLVEITYGGQPLPEGSVVKFGSQKFLKVSGGSMEFVAIEVMPKSEWGWDSSADADWAILQNM